MGRTGEMRMAIFWLAGALLGGLDCSPRPAAEGEVRRLPDVVEMPERILSSPGKSVTLEQPSPGLFPESLCWTGDGLLHSHKSQQPDVLPFDKRAAIQVGWLSLQNRIIRLTLPEYPAEVADKRVSGRVRVLVAVDSAGRSSVTKVLKSPDKRLDAAVIKAVKSWAFQPLPHEATRGDTVTFVDVNFELASESREAKADGVVTVRATNPGAYPSEGSTGRNRNNGRVSPKPPPVRQESVRESGWVYVGGPIRLHGSALCGKSVVAVNPSYPADALNERSVGIVRVDVHIDREGGVTETDLVSSVDPRLARSALRAIHQWRFAPMRINGQPVPIVVAFDVEYSIDQTHMEDRDRGAKNGAVQ